MAGMAKCPLSFDCGKEFIFLQDGESIELEIKGAVQNSLCSYNLYTSPDEGVKKYQFEVSEFSPNGFLGGVYSNNFTSSTESVSGVVQLNFDL